MFTIDGITFDKLRVISFKQSFQVLDGENATRVLSGDMKRDVIGSYFNYEIKIKPQYTEAGMKQYNQLWDICSDTTESHTLIVPYDVGPNVTHTELTYQAYITSGDREMLKYNFGGVDYWKEGTFKFVAMSPTKT